MTLLPASNHVVESPPDRKERERALDSGRSILMQAPAGSGKTDLLTRRFLRLLGEVDEPGEIIAITFTIAAAAEMRHRILAELEKAAGAATPQPAPDEEADGFSMESLARRALHRSQERRWDLLAMPAQLRISTIDSFCRELAVQKPLLSGLGGGISIHERPAELYLRAARRTLTRIDQSGDERGAAIAALLRWRDNNWHELEELLVAMLEQRDRWMQEFVLSSEPDWNALRERLERPFAKALREGLAEIANLFDRVPGAREEAHDLARFACEQTEGRLHRDLAEMAEFPCAPFGKAGELETARAAFLCLSQLLLTSDGTFRQQVNVRIGFAADRKREKTRLLSLIANLRAVDGLEEALSAVHNLPPPRYSEDDWLIVRACFTTLRQAAGELRVVFAETGAADFTEVSQTAQAVLAAEDGLPADAAQSAAADIRHLLVDEFQDTSRRQHRLLAALIAAWPEREGRTLFAVGDPMQSIYFFRDADAELFPRVRQLGLEIPGGEPLPLGFAPLRANFRTAPGLVEQINDAFEKIFVIPDGSGIPFSPAIAARNESRDPSSRFALHLAFVPASRKNAQANSGALSEVEAVQDEQTEEILELIRNRLAQAGEKRERGEKYRIAVLGRTRKALAPIAAALREAAIPFRALDLENLSDRPEVMDALALARALLIPEDRIAWLGVLRAPWCGLSLADLHKLVSDDDEELLARPAPTLLAERLPLISGEGRAAVERVVEAVNAARNLRDALPNASLGTWLEQVWLRMGGADCVDTTARANVDLLWSRLDKLPGGEQDVLGPALDTALKDLTALPDPAANSDWGVQLMTIHKAKGLEFEVVIVPELQARCGQPQRKLLSWLERGVEADDRAETPDNPGEITEFLIAPMQSKGTDPGRAKAWVDSVRRERETQENRRILYVAATRARDELHLFARPSYKQETDGSFTLVEPTNSLLATAWPALEDGVRAQFEVWKTAKSHEVAEPATIETLAAAGQVVAMPSVAKPSFVCRLPSGYKPAVGAILSVNRTSDAGEVESKAAQLYDRHEGGLKARALGTAVHRCMEALARLRQAQDWPGTRDGLAKLSAVIASGIRALGVDATEAEKIAGDALASVRKASYDPVCQWILSPHVGAASEARWAGVSAGGVRTVQADRVFRAGAAPHESGDDCWWIVDFKTYSEASPFEPSALLPRLRELFAPQLEAYAAVLRNLHGASAQLRAGLYYPRLLLFDWWEL
jgi:ATP-dependent helicase/nuclease subunit A